MRYLKIENNGVIDIRLVALMGGTTKSNDKFKIGQFGTGLKYTLAYIFRSNLNFKIYAGEEEIQIHTETEKIREEDFEIICINGKRTSITTKMGEDWEAWMIIRELWCNALDEGGALKEVTTQTKGTSGKTTFFIQIDNQIQDILNHWSKYFIHGQEPIFESEECALYPAGDHFCIYKQGVLIYEDRKRKGVFGYDYKEADINELREYKGTPSMAVVYSLSNCNKNAATYFLENIKPHHFEAEESFDYNWYRSFGSAWREAIGGAKLIHQKALDNIRARQGEIEMHNMIIVPECLYKFLSKQFPGIGALYAAGKGGDFYEDYDVRVENRIKQAITILESCDYFIHPELKFLYGWFDAKDVQARVDLKEKRVYISKNLLQTPLSTVVAVLIEENEHFNTSFTDCSRQFQQHFIDLYARQLLATHSIEI